MKYYTIKERNNTLPTSIRIKFLVTFTLAEHIHLTVRRTDKDNCKNGASSHSNVNEHVPNSCHYSALAFQEINCCQEPIYFTWVECGKYRLIPYQRTLVPYRGSNHNL